MKYSVVIPVYNVEKYLEKCVASVLNQNTESAFEIVLVDDGSTDNSGMVCDRLAVSDARIRVIHQENQWVGAARNTGIRAAAGEYIIFIDPDDTVTPDYLQTMDTLLAEKPDMTMVAYERVTLDGVGAPGECPSIIPHGQSGESWMNELFETDMIPLPFVWLYGYRRAFLMECELLFPEDVRIAEDYDFLMRAIPAARSIVGINHICYRYVENSTSLTAKISRNKVLDILQIKESVFCRYPVSAVANDYTWIVQRVSIWGLLNDAEILNRIKQGRNIIDKVSHPTLLVLRKIIRIFGLKTGIRVFNFAAKIKSVIRK